MSELVSKRLYNVKGGRPVSREKSLDDSSLDS